MNEQRIEQWLRQADRAAGPPPTGPADLADRVRRLGLRRRRVWITSSAVAAALIALSVGATLWMIGLQGKSALPGPEAIVDATDAQTEIDRLEAELEELHAETEVALARVEERLARYQQQAQRARIERLRAQPGPIQQVQQDLDRTAFIMVYQADRAHRELGQAESAVESYRQVLELFPQTPWADVARQRLSAIQRGQGDRL